MNLLYKRLKKGTIWAAEHVFLVRFLSICISTSMIIVGYFIGLELFNSNYEFPLFLPYAIVGVCILTSMLFSANPFNRKGERKRAQQFYFQRIIRYSVYSYCTFLMAVCCGNNDFNENIYSVTDVVKDWSAYVNSASQEQHTAVVYNSAPPVDRLKKKSKKFKLSGKKYRSRKYLKKQNESDITTYQKGLYIFIGIFFIVAAVASAVGVCVFLCIGGTWGIVLAIFAATSFFGSIAMSIYGFKSYRAYKRRTKGKERVRKEKPERKGRRRRNRKAIIIK